jgi:hypothetical protein
VTKNMAVLNELNQVINIIVCEDNELETPTLITYTESNPAYIGGFFEDGYFYSEQPYNSWTKNKGQWESPVPYPDDENFYVWNEDEQSWDEVE